MERIQGWRHVIVAIGVMVGLIVAAPFLQSNGLGLIGLLVFGWLCWAMVQNSRPGALAFDVDVPSPDIILAAVHFFTTHGWSTTTQQGRTITFTKIETPSCLVAIALAIFGLIPGLLYWIAAKRALTLSVTTQPSPGSDTRSQVQLSWNRNGACRTLALDFKQLASRPSPSSGLSLGVGEQ